MHGSRGGGGGSRRHRRQSKTLAHAPQCRSKRFRRLKPRIVEAGTPPIPCGFGGIGNRHATIGAKRSGGWSGLAVLCSEPTRNGFAFLALFARTGDERWLERARAFATHAIAQVARLRAISGRGRYTLFTGDLGAALLAAACITLNRAFPGVDDL